MSPPPRFADAPRRGPPPASAEEVAGLMRRVGYVAAGLVAWALGGAIAALAYGRMEGATLGLVALAPALVALVAYALDRRAPSPAKSALAAGAGTLALAFAIAGHVVHWGGANLTLFLFGAAPWVQWLAFAAVLLVVPLYAGARMRALELAWSRSGSRARSPALALEATGGPRGALSRWAEGVRAPGLALLDAARAAHRPLDLLHADATLDDLSAALASQGALAEERGRELCVKLPDGPTLRIRRARILLPPGPALEVYADPAAPGATGRHGAIDAARRLRRLLEGAAGHALVFSWSEPARRWERRLNALHRDALVAGSLEERSLVMEELDRVRRALAERNLAGEEFTILALKEESARALLAHRMLSEPPGARRERGVLAQHGALLPHVARVVDAGGLAAVKRVAFVPHWVLPVQTRWGEQEVVVSAASGTLDPRESAALLDAMRRRGPVLFLDVGAQAAFLPAPPPTGALLREMRRAGVVVAEDVATGATPADIIYVPYLATAEGYVSGITGAQAAELGNVVPVAPG